MRSRWYWSVTRMLMVLPSRSMVVAHLVEPVDGRVELVGLQAADQVVGLGVVGAQHQLREVAQHLVALRLGAVDCPAVRGRDGAAVALGEGLDLVLELRAVRPCRRPSRKRVAVLVDADLLEDLGLLGLHDAGLQVGDLPLQGCLHAVEAVAEVVRLLLQCVALALQVRDVEDTEPVHLGPEPGDLILGAVEFLGGLPGVLAGPEQRDLGLGLARLRAGRFGGVRRLLGLVLLRGRHWRGRLLLDGLLQLRRGAVLGPLLAVPVAQLGRVLRVRIPGCCRCVAHVVLPPWAGSFARFAP